MFKINKYILHKEELKNWDKAIIRINKNSTFKTKISIDIINHDYKWRKRNKWINEIKYKCFINNCILLVIFRVKINCYTKKFIRRKIERLVCFRNYNKNKNYVLSIYLFNKFA